MCVRDTHHVSFLSVPFHFVSLRFISVRMFSSGLQGPPTPGILSNRVSSDRSKSQGHVPSPLLPFGRFRIDFGSFSVCFQHAVGLCERIFALLPASPPVSITPGVHGEMFEKSFLNLLLSSPSPERPRRDARSVNNKACCALSSIGPYKAL